MNREILPIGDYLPQDENGFIINNLSLEKIDKKWQMVLKMVTRHFVEYLGEDLHGVYVRGSVARGLAVDGVSDLDMFALVKPSFSRENIRWQTADCQLKVEQDVIKIYPFVVSVEMMLATYNTEFLNSKLAMIVKTQSLLLAGENVNTQLKLYKADASMRLNYYWLEADILNFIKIKHTDFTLKKCSEMMKIILRTGFELVITRINKFSPDLYICYRDFSKFYPNRASEMQQVLTWFLNPILDKELLNNFINDFGNWMLKELEIIQNP